MPSSGHYTGIGPSVVLPFAKPRHRPLPSSRRGVDREPRGGVERLCPTRLGVRDVRSPEPAPCRCEAPCSRCATPASLVRDSHRLHEFQLNFWLQTGCRNRLQSNVPKCAPQAAAGAEAPPQRFRRLESRRRSQPRPQSGTRHGNMLAPETRFALECGRRAPHPGLIPGSPQGLCSMQAEAPVGAASSESTGQFALPAPVMGEPSGQLTTDGPGRPLWYCGRK